MLHKQLSSLCPMEDGKSINHFKGELGKNFEYAS